jgi:YggT family protein
MIVIIANVINFIVLVISLLVILKILLSYFVAPYQPVRLIIDRIVDPLLRPIQRIIPPIGGLDISPIILLLIVQVLGRIIVSIFSSVFH